MTISRALGLVIIAAAGVLGAFIGRAVPREVAGVQANTGESPASPATTPADDECEAERSALASTKARLAICMAFDTADPMTAPSDIPEVAAPDPPSPGIEQMLTEQIRSHHGRLESLPEAVIVQEANGTIGIYSPDEWPVDGDGLIIGRKFPNGEIGWYAGPDAGPRSDPAAFRPTKSAIVFGPDFVREADGSIRVRRNAPDWLKRKLERRLGRNTDKPPEP